MSVSKVGRYELRSMLARTPASTVFEGWDGLIARKVAIKIMPVLDRGDPETREILIRFSRGAQAAGMLNHPCIVAVYDYGETDDSAYLVMEYVEGVTLKALLDSPDRMTLQGVRSMVGDVLAGLAYSHQHGVVHRDIKPANIMVLPSGRAKITDFGVARIEHNNITQTGTIIGTPAYMSPEQFLGEPADLRSDIYATGVVLYQMLTGHRPFEGGVATIAHKVLTTEPPPPSQVVPGLAGVFDPVVRRAMAKSRDERYASAEQFARALDDAVATAASDRAVGRGAAALPSVLRPDVRLAVSQRGRRHPGTAGLPILAGAGLALAVGAAFWFLRPTTPLPSPRSAPATSRIADVQTPPAPLPGGVPEVDQSPPRRQAVADARAGESAGKAPVPTLPAVDPVLSRPATPVIAGIAAVQPDIHDATVPLIPPRAAPSVLRASPPRAPPPPRPANPDAVTPLVGPPVAPPEPPPEIKRTGLAERPHVRIFYPGSSAAALEQTTDIARHLLFSDFMYADTRSSSNGPRQSEVRYFHPPDRASAERLAALLGDIDAGFQVQDWSDRGVSAPSGVLEVWIGR